MGTDGLSDQPLLVEGLTCHTQGIRGYGNPFAQVAYIGIAPGREEEIEGRPFVGSSGKVLRSTTQVAGWSMDEVWATNLICWRKDAPNKDEIAACHGRLYHEITTKPNLKLLVLFGGIVTEVFQQTTFGKVRGIPMWHAELGLWMMTTYHPAAIVRGGRAFIHDLYRDLQKIPDVITWPADRGKVTFDVLA